jgi:hypothetical protein
MKYATIGKRNPLLRTIAISSGIDINQSHIKACAENNYLNQNFDATNRENWPLTDKVATVI